MLLNHFKKDCYEAGCDEAGRGCLAGPVFAAAVILPVNFENPGLNDSKKMTEKKRYELRDIIEKEALAWAIASIDNHEIDKINIFRASMMAMHKAINQLNISPEHLIIDGHLFLKYAKTPHTCIIKGDGKYCSIAAASVLAKTYRDDYMKKLHKEYNMYNWDKNKGYATAFHRKAIEEHGISPYHRRSFTLKNKQLKLDL